MKRDDGFGKESQERAEGCSTLQAVAGSIRQVVADCAVLSGGGRLFRASSRTRSPVSGAGPFPTGQWR